MIPSGYLREDRLPHLLCAGCGHGIALQALLRAAEKVNLPREGTVFVGGIGCSSRLVNYLNFDALHTTHGRALAFATGIKLARPELRVVVITGDGDLAAIGGNHLIHAARRNIGVTVLCLNNENYGMTSGQYSPTTPRGMLATTAPYGNLDRPFDLCRLAEAAGATYVARGGVHAVFQLANFFARALTHDGFALVDVLSPCPTYFGRRNRLGDGKAMLHWQQEHTVSLAAAGKKTPEELAGRMVLGEFVRREEPEYAAACRELSRREGAS